MKIKKIPYQAPSIKVLFLEMEEGFATNSASVQPGGNTSMPKVEEWTEEGSFTKDFDI